MQAQIGTTIEWYDFLLYGTAAALVFPKLFFPRFNSLAGTLASFATFGVAFIARPIGGIVFGHFGDRVPVRLRYSGISFSYQVAGLFAGGLAPILATALIHWSGGASWPVATYLAVIALVSFVSVYLASERYRMGTHDELRLSAASPAAN